MNHEHSFNLFNVKYVFIINVRMLLCCNLKSYSMKIVINNAAVDFLNTSRLVFPKNCFENTNDDDILRYRIPRPSCSDTTKKIFIELVLIVFSSV